MILRTKINEILENWFADEAMVYEINAALDDIPPAVSMLKSKSVTQAEIRDWATLNGYALIKVNSIDARLRVEKVAREIWGDAEGDKYFLE